MRIKISGTGSYTPEFVLTNEGLSKMVDTSDEWIVKRTGIRERRINLSKAGWEMGAEAAKRAINDSGISPEEISGIIVSTATQDCFFPSAACCIQRETGAGKAVAVFDINAACSGFVYALSIAESMMKSGASGEGHVLVVCCENLSRVTDYTDRSTCVLFGDGAGAVVLSRTEEDCGILSTTLYADGKGADLMHSKATSPALGNEDGTVKNNPKKTDPKTYMLGGEILKFAIRIIPDVLSDALGKIDMTKNEVSHFLFHQANLRIVTGAADRIGGINDKIRVNIEKYGNTSSASIPILLDEIKKDGILKDGDIIAAVGFGAGLTAGASIIRWGN